MTQRMPFLLSHLMVFGLLACATPPVWATNGQPDAHKGGTLRILAQSDAGTLDPQISYIALTKVLETPVYDTL
ncbi:MAG: ABC transporter substrate-binding protein, partial [Acetobacter sp.]|nr:ABC transporter substrate-binding protein [Acetobacter sp.]